MGGIHEWSREFDRHPEAALQPSSRSRCRGKPGQAVGNQCNVGVIWLMQFVQDYKAVIVELYCLWSLSGRFVYEGQVREGCRQTPISFSILRLGNLFRLLGD